MTFAADDLLGQVVLERVLAGLACGRQETYPALANVTALVLDDM